MTTPFEGFSQLEPGGAPTEVGQYRLYARLGVGGMGQVYLSFLPGGRPVALKVVREEFAADPEFRRRFAQEAHAAQQVNGIHIAQLLDADPVAPTPWLATAYIPGPSLLEAVRLHGPLPADSVRVLMAGVAQALDAIHAAGIIHRDLKPANVILAADGPRVIDFGIARAADATTASLTGKRIGSPQYMAPEQVRGLPATPALDVFALGALAFFAATGRAAFGEGEDLAVIFRIVQEEPDLAGCPPELLELVTACLAKDPAARPDTQAILQACQVTEPDATGGWLPPAIAQSIAARASAIAALASQPPPTPPPTAPETQATATLTQPGAQRPSGVRGLGARLKVGAITLAFGVLIGAVLVLTVFRSPSNGNAANSTGRSTTAPATTPAASGAAPSGASFPSGGGAGTSTDEAAGGSTPSDTASAQSGGGGILSTSTASPLANSGTDTIQWQGAITFGKDGVGLDDIPPQNAPGYPDIYYAGSSNSNSGYNFATSWTMSLWTGSGVPSRSQCYAQVTGSGSTGVVTPANTLICVKTAQDRIALVQIQSVDTTDNIVSAYVRVWNQPIGS